MFIQHKELKSLQVPAEKITHLHAATSRVQLAFAGYQPQLCQAYLLQISGESKVLTLVAFYLSDSDRSIFFVPSVGELPLAEADTVYEEGYSFAESMGFVLSETDFHIFPLQKKKEYWAALPICQLDNNVRPVSSTVSADKDVEMLRLRSRKSLGRFLASM